MAGPPPPITTEGSRMTFDRVAIVESALDTYLAQAAASPRRLAANAPLREGSGLTARKAMELFEDQLNSVNVRDGDHKGTLTFKPGEPAKNVGW